MKTEDIRSGSRNEQTRKHALDQFREATRTGKVTCECGHGLPLRFAYRCYYCGCFFCDPCAAKHFGQTREEYYANDASDHACVS